MTQHPFSPESPSSSFEPKRATNTLCGSMIHQQSFSPCPRWIPTSPFERVTNDCLWHSRPSRRNARRIKFLRAQTSHKHTCFVVTQQPFSLVPKTFPRISSSSRRFPPRATYRQRLLAFSSANVEEGGGGGSPSISPELFHHLFVRPGLCGSF